MYLLPRNPTVDGRNPANQLRLVVYPIIYRVFYIQGGAGFQPSDMSFSCPFRGGGTYAKASQSLHDRDRAVIEGLALGIFWGSARFKLPVLLMLGYFIVFFFNLKTLGLGWVSEFVKDALLFDVVCRSFWREIHDF